MDWEQWQRNNELIGHLGREEIRRSQEETNRLLKEQKEEREREKKEKQREQERLAQLPDCPYCATKLPKQGVAVCASCQRDVIWVEDIPCKDDDVSKEAAEKAVAERRRLEEAQRVANLKRLQEDAERKRENERLKREEWKRNEPQRIAAAKLAKEETKLKQLEELRLTLNGWKYITPLAILSDYLFLKFLPVIYDFSAVSWSYGPAIAIVPAWAIFLIYRVGGVIALFPLAALFDLIPDKYSILSSNQVMSISNEYKRREEHYPVPENLGYFLYCIPFGVIALVPNFWRNSRFIKRRLKESLHEQEKQDPKKEQHPSLDSSTTAVLEDNVAKIKHQYYLKRDDTVKGPLQYEQVVTFIESKKAKKTDLISRSKDGPFQGLEDFWKTHRKK